VISVSNCWLGFQKDSLKAEGNRASNTLLRF
jgi:hypothetical protein